jgi:hypothetical protein
MIGSFKRIRAMKDIVVRDVDERTYRALERIAVAEGRSLADWIRHKLELEAVRTDQSVPRRPTRQEVQRRSETAAHIRAMSQPIHEDSTLLIRADRDREH